MNSSQINFNMGKLSGRFMDIEAFKCDESGREIPGSRRKVCDDFDNLITNGGLDWWSGAYYGMSYDTPLNRLSVGSGSSAPQFTDENLQSPVAIVDRQGDIQDGYTVDGNTRFAWTRRTYTFGQGVAAGNLSEMGTWCSIGLGGSSPTERILFSRALITDANGNPTTITILPDEFLTVTYELRVYRPNLATQTNIVNIGGTPREISVSPVWLNNPTVGNQRMYVTGVTYDFQISGHLNAAASITQLPTPENLAGAVSVPASSWSSYAAGTYERTATFNFGIGNSGQAWSIEVPVILVRSQLGYFQMTIDPPLNKNQDQSMTLSIKLTWGRYSP